MPTEFVMRYPRGEIEGTVLEIYGEVEKMVERMVFRFVC